ncbi:diacylglycerol/lipid kinase family protein [Breznakiella homolactica]|uniref:Diacylglycerol kinase family lipid kinase n=1 Tax=Breznakiella homolactica TaxID=2798577 RepID=A0A7T8BCP6_9SPIR|nr:diacylglycerol kinase family protein [Breznakiella homolactica]QQO10488.1 diacylglycerol kinase family lipid kinase [Breznakiella homolactica]
MQKQNILLIINPVAGRKKANKIVYQIVDSLSRNNCRTVIFMTTRKGEATDLIIEHAHDCHKIICCGGDGTLSEVLSGLIRLDMKIPVGYIPTGTTNDFAHSLNLPTDIDSAIEATTNGHIQKHDIGSFNEGQYFSYVASFGAFSKVSYSTPQWLKNFFGHMAYIFNGILSITGIRPHKVKVIADGDEIAGDFIFGSVSNSKVIGGIVRFLESDVSFDDGKFEVLLIKKPRSIKDFGRIVKGVFRRRYDDQNICFFKASKVSFAFEKDTDWTIDGEYAGTLCNVQIKNLPCTAQVMIV